MKKIWLCAAIVLALPGLTGCGGSSSSGSNAPALVPHSVSATLSNGLTGTLTEDRSTVAVGGTVNYTVTLTNRTAQPITYQHFFDGDPAENAAATLLVTDHAGQTVWAYSTPALAVGTTGPITLVPGQSVSAVIAVTTQYGLNIPAYAASGQYTASADFLVVPGASPGASQASVTAGPLPVTAQ